MTVGIMDNQQRAHSIEALFRIAERAENGMTDQDDGLALRSIAMLLMTQQPEKDSAD